MYLMSATHLLASKKNVWLYLSGLDLCRARTEHRRNEWCSQPTAQELSKAVHPLFRGRLSLSLSFGSSKKVIKKAIKSVSVF
jgi:hypothetical protein